MYKRIFRISILSITFLILVTTNVYSDSISRNLGINLFVSQQDYCRDRLFTDAMKTARKWKEPGYYGNGNIVDIDEYGWPMDDAEVIVWHGIPNMNGTYYLEGYSKSRPDIRPAGYGGGKIINFSYDNVLHKFTANLIYETAGSQGLLLMFQNTNGGVKNVKLMKPIEPGSSISYSTDTTFTDVAKDMVNDFSVIRFMWAIDGWNGPWQVEWSERVPPDYSSFNRNMGDLIGRGNYSYVTWAGTGMSWEYAIEFCNETGKDMWINMPIAASDDYIYKLAQLIKDNYTVPNGYVYWEYSNEATWDLEHRCSNYIGLVSQKEADLRDIIDYDGVRDENVLKNRYYAMRSVKMSQIWRDVWGDADMMTKIRPIHSGHLTYNNQAVTGLMFVNNWYNNGDGNNVADPHPVSYFFYGTGGSHYTGDNPDEEKEDGYSEIEVFEKYEEEEACLAKMYGLKRVAYEGGVWTSPDEYLLPRISDAMIRYQELWDKYDNDLLMYYVTTGGEDNGTALGFTLDSQNLSTPKYDALHKIINSPKSEPTAGKLVPCTIEGADFSCSSVPHEHPEPAGIVSTGSGKLDQWHRYKGYLFRVSEYKQYSFKILHSRLRSADVEIMIDGNTISDETEHDAHSTLFSFLLDTGLHAISIRIKNDTTIKINEIIIE